MPLNALHKDFLRLYTPVQNALYRFICSLHPNFSEAEDILQDVVIVAWEKFDTFDSGEMEFRSWLFAIARYKVLHSKRSFLRKNKFLDKAQSQLCEDYFSEQGSLTQTEDKQEALQQCIKKLPPEQQSLLVLRYHKKVKCQDLAEKMQRSHAQIRTQLHRLRASLKSCINLSRNP